jgi:hypothetical protein
MSKVAHPLLLWQSVMAAAQVAASAAGLADIIGTRPASVLVLVVGAAQVATAFYAHGNATAPAPTPTGGTP